MKERVFTKAELLYAVQKNHEEYINFPNRFRSTVEHVQMDAREVAEGTVSQYIKYIEEC